MANQAPIVTGSANLSFATNQTIAATALYTSASDPDGSISKIRFWDASAQTANSYFMLDGVKITTSFAEAIPSQLNRVTFFTGTVGGFNDIIVEAFDNLNLDSNDLAVRVTTTAPVNQAPIVTGSANLSFATNQTIAATALYTSASDPDGSISKIRFWDASAQTANSYFMLDGVKITTSFAEAIPSQLNRVTFFTGTVGGFNDIIVEAFDNLNLDSNDLAVRVTTTAPVNQAPIVTGSANLSFATNQTIAATALYTSASDPDGSISKIRFWDASAQTANSYFMLDGVKITTSFAEAIPSQLNRVTFFTGTVGGFNDIIVEAFDNLNLDSNDLAVRVTTTAPVNQAPIVTGSANLSFATNQTIAATALYTSASDPDGSISKIRFWDASAQTANSYFMLDGVKITTSFAEAIPSQLNRVTFFTGTVGGFNDIIVEAFDNLNLDSNDLAVRVTTTAPIKTGEALVQEAKQHLGQEYFWGVSPGQTAYANPNYAGPWDCSEFVSWTVNKAYGEQIGLRAWDAFTGHWAEDANLGSKLHYISMTDARNTPGAIIFRFDSGLHHIAISEGNGKLIEANVNYHGGFYWSDDGTPRAALSNGDPPSGVDIGDVGERSFDLSVYSAANGWKAVEVNDVSYTTIPVVTPPAGPGADDYEASTSTTGRLAIAGAITGKIETAGDTDWFKIDNLVAGHSYKVLVTGDGTTQLADTFFSIRDATTSRVTGSSSRLGGQAYDDAGGSRNALVEFTAEQFGPHYVVVGGGGANFATLTGGYRVALTEVPEPGGSTSSATAIALNASPQQGFVGYGADAADYYKFTPQNSGQATINLTGLGADIDAVVLNSVGQRIDTLASNSTSAEQRTTHVTAGQTYYIEVAPHSPGVSSQQSPYAINVEFVVPGGVGALPNATTLFEATGGRLTALAEFARAAYDGDHDKPGDRQVQEQMVADLGTEGWAFLGANDLPELTFDGPWYEKDNASAMAARAKDALVISFRGTDDWYDRVDWFNMNGTILEGHNGELKPFVSAVDTYISNWNIAHSNSEDISTVYVTGHSLGAAMANWYMFDHPNANGVTYDAAFFANPGYFYLPQKVDPRTTQFYTQDDVITLASVPKSNPGDTNKIFFGDGDDGISLVSSDQHSMTLYESIINFIFDSKVGNGVPEDLVVSSGIGRYDNIVVPVGPYISADRSLSLGIVASWLAGKYFNFGKDDDQVSGGDSPLNYNNRELLLGGEGKDTLTGYGGDDLLYGGAGDDTYMFSSILPWGQDTIVDTGGADVIDVGDSNGTISVHSEGRDLVIKFTPSILSPGFLSGGTIRIDDYYNLGGQQAIETLRWNDTDHELANIVAKGELRFDPAIDAVVAGFQTVVAGGKATLNAAVWAGSSIYANLKDGWSKFSDWSTNWITGPKLPEATFTEVDGFIGKTVTLSGISNIIGTQYNDKLVGDAEPNELEGGAGNDLVQADGGDDFIIGGSGAGDDSYDGGDGRDTVVYEGMRSQFEIALQSSGLLRVSDERDGSPDGTDTLGSIEVVQFADGYYRPVDNHLPIAKPTSATQGTPVSQSAVAATLFAATDLDGDTIIQYQLFDTATGGGQIEVGGIAQTARQLVTVNTVDLTDAAYRGGANVGSEVIGVRAYDGTGWSEWTSWQMNTLRANNVLPVINGPASKTLERGQAARLSTFLSVTDTDNDPMVRFEVHDNNSAAGSTVIWANGALQVQGFNGVANTASLSDIWVLAGSNNGTDTLEIRAHDGFGFGDWKSIDIIARGPNRAPVVTPTAATQSVTAGQSAAFGSLFGATDADGNNTITQYQLFDTTVGGGQIKVNGVAQTARQLVTVSTANLASVTYQGGVSAGFEALGVRAFDGLTFSEWTSWQMNTLRAANALPVVNGPTSKTFERGQAAPLSSFLSVTDTDGDPIVRFEVHDNNGAAGSTLIWANGALQAQGFNGVANTTSLSDIWVLAGPNNGTDNIEIRANDGFGFGNWKSIDIVTRGPNRAPVVTPTAVTQSVNANQTKAFSLMFNTTDADGDPIAQFQLFDTGAGGGRIEVNGQPKDARTIVTVNSLDNVIYRGGTSAGSEVVGVQAHDGTTWSGWTNWQMNTLAA